jgi:hypothetical protein
MDRFKEWRESFDDNAREGRPSMSFVGENNQRVHDLVMTDRCITIRIITDKLGSSKGSVQTILKEYLNMRKLCAKIGLKVLTQEQKRRCVACCQDWMENEEGSNFLQRVITGDESWIYEYDPETKRQSEEWMHGGSPRSKKAYNSRSKIKIMFFFIRGVVHHEFVPQGQRDNTAFYVEVCVNVCDVHDLNCGQKRTGSCITTMHPHTRHLLCVSFSPKMT